MVVRQAAEPRDGGYTDQEGLAAPSLTVSQLGAGRRGPDKSGGQSVATTTGLGPPHRLVDDLPSDHDKLAMLVLAEGLEPLERLVLSTSTSTHHDADGPLDDPSGLECRLQLPGQSDPPPNRVRRRQRALR